MNNACSSGMDQPQSNLYSHVASLEHSIQRVVTMRHRMAMKNEQLLAPQAPVKNEVSPSRGIAVDTGPQPLIVQVNERLMVLESELIALADTIEISMTI